MKYYLIGVLTAPVIYFALLLIFIVGEAAYQTFREMRRGGYYLKAGYSNRLWWLLGAWNIFVEKLKD